MPKFCGEVILNCSKELAFEELISTDFTKKISPGLKDQNIEIIFQNGRILHTSTKMENYGKIEMEKIFIPENFTIVAQRKPPLAPFTYFLGLQMLYDHRGGSLLKWIEEFETDADNKPREEGIATRFEQNEIHHFQNVQKYFKECAV